MGCAHSSVVQSVGAVVVLCAGALGQVADGADIQLHSTHPSVGPPWARLRRGHRLLVCTRAPESAAAGPVAKSKGSCRSRAGRGEGSQAHTETAGCGSGAPESPRLAVSKSLNLAGPPFPHLQREGSETLLPKVPFHKWASVIL